MGSENALVSYVFASKYEIVKKIASGSYGTVYLGKDKNTKQTVAIKLEAITDGKSTLSNEKNIYRYLKECKCVPRIFSFGQDHGYNMMVMQLLGPSLSYLHSKYTRFSLKTVLQLANQILLGLEYLHKQNIIHRDIKPGNFLILRGKVFIIDFGLAKQYKKYEQYSLVNCRENGVIGTAKFASCNTHLHHPQSARDDLESLGYMLIYLLKGKLPWCDCESKIFVELFTMVGVKKIATEVEVVCDGLPEEFTAYLKYCRDLKFIQEPNYEHLREIFISLAARMDYTFDNVFEWTESQES